MRKSNGPQFMETIRIIKNNVFESGILLPLQQTSDIQQKPAACLNYLSKLSWMVLQDTGVIARSQHCKFCEWMWVSKCKENICIRFANVDQMR